MLTPLQAAQHLGLSATRPVEQPVMQHCCRSIKMKTLADAFQPEMARVRKVLGHYKEIGPAGIFAATFIERDLRDAEEAVLYGDVVQMLRTLEALRGIKD